MPTPIARTVIIGVGNPMCGDDGVGHALVSNLERAPHDGVEFMTLDGESTRLIEAWSNRHKAVVVDAIVSGSTPGEIRRIDALHDPLPGWASGSSSHSAGLANAVALATALDRLPQQLIVFGVEAGDVTLGAGLSDAVQAALPDLVDQITIEFS